MNKKGHTINDVVLMMKLMVINNLAATCEGSDWNWKRYNEIIKKVASIELGKVLTIKLRLK